MNTDAPVVLEYRAPAGCPSAPELMTEVRRSTAHLRWALPGEAGRRFTVTIDDSGRAGRLVVGAGVEGAAQGERAVTGADCAEVSRVLAFAVALAADPDAHAAEASSVAAFPEPEAPSASTQPATSTASASPQHAEAAREPAPGPTVRTPKTFSVGAFLLTKSASAPGLTLGGGAFGELGLPALPLSPHGRLGLGYARKEVTSGPGNVSFSSYFATLDVCSALGPSRLTVLPCLRALGGLRDAAGHHLLGARGATRPFLELGVSAHLRWRFAGSVFAELGGALLFPTGQDTVLILPASVVYRVPAVAGLGELSLGVEFGDQNPR